MFALDVHDEHHGGDFVHGADAVEILLQAGGLAADGGLLLFAVVGQRAVGVHLLDFLEPLDGGLDGVEIRERAAEPAFGDEKLFALLRGLLDALLRLFFGADKNHLAALADDGAQKVAGCLKLRERFAQVNDVDAVAGLEDERLHLGVPALRLVSEMNA